jgi:hypothetical protein
MSRAELAFPSIIFALVAAFAAGGIVLGEYPWGVIVFPFGAACAVCILCAIEIVRIRTAKTASETQSEQTDDKISLKALAWLFALAPFLYGLGFVFGSAAYLLACLWANGVSWRLSIPIAAVSLLVTLGLFIKLMGVLLPVAPLWLG